jgi:hypothetical protein
MTKAFGFRLLAVRVIYTLVASESEATAALHPWILSSGAPIVERSGITPQGSRTAMMLWLLALFVTVALLILAFVIAYVLVSIYLRGGNSTRPLPKMSQVRGFIVRHTLLVFFIFSSRGLWSALCWLCELAE